MATGKRIKDPTLTEQTSFVPSYRFLVDKMDTGSGDWLQARNMELGLLGNTYFQGSINGINWHDAILATDTYYRFSTDGGVTWKNLDTDTVREGSLNLYYTEARVSANTDVAANTADRHSHSNKSVLDGIVDSGPGTNVFTDDGLYRSLSTLGALTNPLLTNLDFDGYNAVDIGTLGFNGGQALSWNSEYYTVDIPTGLGPVLQVGQEFYFVIYNNTGVQIDNGSVVKPTGATLVGSEIIPTVILAKADDHSTCEGTLMVVTADIANGATGLGTITGRVRDVDTSTFSPGDDLFLSATVAGALTNVQPVFPNYILSVGGVLKVGTTDGQIAVNFTNKIEDTFNNAWDGGFRETMAFSVSSNGSTVTGSLERSGGGDLTMIFSTGFATLDCTPATTVTLTAGTDSIPQMNYIYIPESTGVLTASTVGFPAAEHIKVADVYLRSAATTQTEGALGNRNWNDHVKIVGDNGHLLHITEKLRQFEAQWDSGVAGTATIVGPTPDDIYVSVTSGTVYQLHKQTFPALDTQTGDDVHIVNHSTTPFLTVSNLNGQTSDALGVSLANKSFSFVMWGVQNKSGEPSHLMINLPTGSYAKNDPDSAVSDPLNYSVYSIPSEFTGKGFLIARFTFTLDSGGTDWVLYDTEDLRGKIPNTTAGGGAGGTGVTTLLGLTDTPSTYVGAAGKRVQVTSGETAVEFVDVTGTKGITIESPTSSEDICMFYVNEAITITNIYGVLKGSATPSVTINPIQTTDRSAAGTAILSAPTAITNTTTGQDLTSFNDATVPSGSWIVFKTTAQSGTVDQICVTIAYTID